jgi:hypothetical protein
MNPAGTFVSHAANESGFSGCSQCGNLPGMWKILVTRWWSAETVIIDTGSLSYLFQNSFRSYRRISQGRSFIAET